MRVSAGPCQNTLIIPKRHVSDYFDLHQPERNAIDQLLRDRKQAIEAEDVLRVRGLPLAGDGVGSPQVDFLQDELIVLSAYKFHGHYLAVAVSLEVFVPHSISNQCRHARLSNQG